MPRYVLGLDSSTQSLSSMLLNIDSGEVVDDRALNFDTILPQYGTENGVMRDADPMVVHSSPVMWAEALDILFRQMKDEGLPLSEVVAISGSGQQHGSVYLRDNIEVALANLADAPSLSEAVRPCLSRDSAPVWMDSSTHAECEEIRATMGGKAAMVAATGSDCFERFTGPQIRKFAKQAPTAYGETAHIALVSSFVSSLIAGKVSAIDVGDGAGMNLMDIAHLDWNEEALNATAEGLGNKLPAVKASHEVLGNVSPYFVQNYGVNADALAVVWSGDNPCSLIGLGLVEPGLMAISLGTSDTMFGAMSTCNTDPRGEGHVFGSPAGGYMTLLCFKNGSLAREKIKDQYNLDWDAFSQALRDTPLGNDGKMILPYFEPEIVPRVLTPGVHRKNLSEEDVAGNCRAVVEAQMMSMRLHSEWMGERPAAIYATGGASANAEIIQIMANVMGAPVYLFESTNSAAMGAALRAAHALDVAEGGEGDWKAIVAPFAKPVHSSKVEPQAEAVAVYNEQMKAFAAFEAERVS